MLNSNDDLQMHLFSKLPYASCIIDCGITYEERSTDTNLLCTSNFIIVCVNKKFEKCLTCGDKVVGKLSFMKDLLHSDDQHKFYSAAELLISNSILDESLSNDKDQEDVIYLRGLRTLTHKVTNNIESNENMYNILLQFLLSHFDLPTQFLLVPHLIGT